MTPEKLAFINLIARIGFEAAIVIWKNVSSAPTIDDAIVALEKSANKPWEQYKLGI